MYTRTLFTFEAVRSFLRERYAYDQGNGIEVVDQSDLISDGEDTFTPQPSPIQNRGWAVFAPSGAVVWRSFETSREDSLRAYLRGDSPIHLELWEESKKNGWTVREIEWVEVEPRP